MVSLALLAGACAGAPVAAPATPTVTSTVVAQAATATATPAPETQEAAPTIAVTVAATEVPPVAPTVEVQVVPPTPTPTATATQPPSPLATATQPTSPMAAAVPVTSTAAATVTATVGVPPSTAALTVNGQRVTYSYPNGWELKQETKDSYSQISLEAPQNALLSLTIYGMEMQPHELSASLLDELQGQFTGAAATPITGTIASYPAEGYTLTFTYLGVPMTGTILAFRGDKASFTWYTQSANEDLPAVQPGFDLVKNTLVVR
jgi:hypothetical protein